MNELNHQFIMGIELGFAMGLQVACLMMVIAFVWKGESVKRSIRKYLDKYEAEQRKKRGL